MFKARAMQEELLHGPQFLSETSCTGEAVGNCGYGTRVSLRSRLIPDSPSASLRPRASEVFQHDLGVQMTLRIWVTVSLCLSSPFARQLIISTDKMSL